MIRLVFACIVSAGALVSVDGGIVRAAEPKLSRALEAPPVVAPRGEVGPLDRSGELSGATRATVLPGTGGRETAVEFDKDERPTPPSIAVQGGGFRKAPW